MSYFFIAYAAFNIFCSSVGVISSLINIYLIYSMTIKDHLLLLLVMNCNQFFYDLTFPLSTINTGYYTVNIALSFQIYFGTVSFFVSNIIAFMTCYIVYYQQIFQVRQHLAYLLLIINAIALTNAILYLTATMPRDDYDNYLAGIAVDYIFSSLRLFSISFNFISICAAWYKLEQTKPTNGRQSTQDTAIYSLFRRMIFYPLGQSFCRIGIVWYTAQYHSIIGEEKGDHISSLEFFVMLLVAATPLLSLFYLTIFIYTQPTAYKQLKKLGKTLRCMNTQQDEAMVNDPRKFSISSGNTSYTGDSIAMNGSQSSSQKKSFFSQLVTFISMNSTAHLRSVDDDIKVELPTKNDHLSQIQVDSEVRKHISVDFTRESSLMTASQLQLQVNIAQHIPDFNDITESEDRNEDDLLDIILANNFHDNCDMQSNQSSKNNPIQNAEDHRISSGCIESPMHHDDGIDRK